MGALNSKKTKNTYEFFLSALAIGSTLILLIFGGSRHITSIDLGYHLSFGETFFNSKTIVDHTPFIYNTLPLLETPGVGRPEPGPGSWYDTEGRYYFINTSWLSQLFTDGSRAW